MYKKSRRYVAQVSVGIKKECMLIEYMITKLNSEWWVDVTCINHVADFGL